MTAEPESGARESESDALESRFADRPVAPGLYLVATPIGNLEDMTLRGLRILRGVDRIACEDTRQTAKLLAHYGITTSTVSYHRHNEVGRAAELAELLRAGGKIAVVSDAGTPGIADPGAEIVAAAIAAGVAVFPVPGANAVLSAVTASGLETGGGGGFRFRGFLPAKAGQRRTVLEGMREAATGELEVFYEAPHRIVETLGDVEAVFGSAERVAVARELTKLHEEFLRGTVAEVRAVLAGREVVRGEMVLVLAPKGEATDAAGSVATAVGVAAAVGRLIAAGAEEKEALKQVARERGMGKSEVYREWQRTRSAKGASAAKR